LKNGTHDIVEKLRVGHLAGLRGAGVDPSPDVLQLANAQRLVAERHRRTVVANMIGIPEHELLIE